MEVKCLYIRCVNCLVTKLMSALESFKLLYVGLMSLLNVLLALSISEEMAEALQVCFSV